MTWLHIVCSTKLRLMQHEGEGMRLSTQRQGIGLLSQIEQDVLDEGKSLGAALRRCMLLGSRTGSSQLREWATLELKGYPVRAEVPEYRLVDAGLHIDAVTINAVIKGHRSAARPRRALRPARTLDHADRRRPG